MAEKKNVTVTLDPDVARWARVWAAEHDTSVSRMLGDLLRDRMLEEREYEARCGATSSLPRRCSGTRTATRAERSCMIGPVFVDTNVLVYARDAFDPAKQQAAHAWMSHLWRSREGRLSFQVLHEFYTAVTRKLKPGLPVPEARDDVRSLLAWRPVPLDGHVLEGAFRVQDRHGLSWWDSMIVAAAQLAGCRTLLSEDLQHGQQLDHLVICSPFRQAPPGGP